jgi:hypothetical protein
LTRQRTRKTGTGPASSRQLWLVLLLCMLPAAALAWREYPALVRYIKIVRMLWSQSQG